ncbi:MULTISPECIES: cobalamin-binding protein [unclassified Undibacterium]|uniref:cobalamin-binding protein n=1 Tax=unclassified Undibacterium TaxID=2630295 RepID=UPI002AC8A88D|nr:MULTISPECIES: cobalamin-binding protein [unclassified Undibacterium]MEB0140038.1 cobalamin-binding protein [Undibacterium sp. CCC2.1]MEB0173049.1 cobalamin-binding protein [Undibacterium sp. CCC1.1]MEB0176861.1 cobalamin-binding protein [Undibacterium sp. CCC3.4]MEB0216093.1 cobalamin-binding protein [Undibacterium sp. 5I2]WPX42024.1 cobalamin-binding protein [Undibacterium sp. CCC3.4]
MQLPARLALCILTLLASSVASAALCVIDDAGRNVCLERPAQRIVSLAPHATELLFAAGAATRVIAVSDYSDYPLAARNLPSIGNVFAIDTERLLAIQPDLVVIWGTGNARQLAQQLRNKHIHVFESEPRDFETVASSIERLALLAGTEALGRPAAAQFRQRLAGLRERYRQPASTPPLTVLYQVWKQPLMTLNDEHLISAAIRLCGGKNPFGLLKETSPTITTEAVLAADPAMIVTGADNTDSLMQWRTLPVLQAVRKNHLVAIKADWLNRAGPRILDGTEALCKEIAQVRKP